MNSATATPESDLPEPEKPAVVASGEVGLSSGSKAGGESVQPDRMRIGSSSLASFLLPPRPDSRSLWRDGCGGTGRIDLRFENTGRLRREVVTTFARVGPTWHCNP